MEYLKIVPRHGNQKAGIIKVSKYDVEKTGERAFGTAYVGTRINNILQCVFYTEDCIDVHGKNTCMIASYAHEPTIIEKITRKEYYEILNGLKNRKYVRHNNLSIEEPYMIDKKNSTNTLVKVVPKPGFEYGKRRFYTWEYYESLGAAYPEEHWEPFVNEPYEIKIDTKWYPGRIFMPEESTIEKSVFRITWPRKKELEKNKGICYR